MAGFFALSVLPLFIAQSALSREEHKVLDAISEQNLRANLSFLASDALGGRGTPSPELDIAAEFIASRFRNSGLIPGSKDSYFQIGTWKAGDATLQSKNVIGVLPGTDPKLKQTYILVTAHYDHLGKREKMEGDNIFNGANDDGSGTVGVIELANAMRDLKLKRSIVFMTFYGEERGMLGSRFYSNNPIFPLLDTIVNVNLEQIGRTDDDEGKRVSAVSVTGLDYSSLEQVLTSSGKRTGIKVEKHPQFSDPYFYASDNASLAQKGVPAHTICTAFSYPDYHKVGDHWDKIDYANMTKVLRMVALSLMDLANSDKPVTWNEKNAKTERFRTAQKNLKSGTKG